MILGSRQRQAHSVLPTPYPTQGLRSIVLSLGVTALLASIATAPVQALSLTFVGEGNLSATDSNGNSVGSSVGGFSGITYSGTGTNYFVVSDSPTTPRVYTIDITISGTTITPTLAGVNNIAGLEDSTSDLEGIARDAAGNIFLSSEGQYNFAFNVAGDNATATVSPFVKAFDNTFNNTATLTLPSLFTSTTTEGPRSNLALESLTITPDGNSLFTAVEAALKQDQSFASLTGGTNGSLNRILRFDLSSSMAAEQYLYTTDVGFGLSDLLAADNAGTFYALERAADSSGTITGIRIFETSIAGATDISGNTTGLGGNITGITQATKKLLVDFADKKLALFNYEGLAFDSTGSYLIVVSDNNFNGASSFAVFTPVPFGIESGWLSTLSLLGVVGGIAAKQKINKRGPDQ